MKFSIAKKLGLGFGIVILLMIVSATIANANLRRMNGAIGKVVDEAVPTVRSCHRLLNGVNESLGALRGYMILGKTPEQADVFRTTRAAAWQKIEGSLDELNAHVNHWDDNQLRAQLLDVSRILDEFRAVQQTIEDTTHTPGNVPSSELLSSQASPHAAAALAALTAIIDEEKNQAASAERRELLFALADTRGRLALGVANIRAYLFSGELSYKQSFQQQWALNQQAFDDAKHRQGLFTPTQQEHWRKFMDAREQLASLAPRLFGLREVPAWNKAEFLLATEAAPRAKRLTEALAKIAATADRRSEQSQLAMDTARLTVIRSLWSATLAAVLTGSTIALLLSRRIVTLMGRLAKRAREIAKGDLTGDALRVSSGDELGVLANGFDAMLGNLRNLTEQIFSVTTNVNTAASQISSSARQQASSTKEQASTVQEITSTMQEIAQSGRQIVERAREVAEAAEATAEQSKAGIGAVQNTSQTMESIREQVEEVAMQIVSLSEKTQAVAEIIATVNDIAEQSNLLALNASIEAVSADGEGRRFSVVANEMKNLADQAKACTVQVRNILGEVHKGINSAVMLTEEAVKRVELGKEHAEVSENAIRKMLHTTDESVQAFQQIIGATNQQQIGFEQVTQGMRDIDQATKQTASGTAQLEQAVVNLSAMSQQLKTAVGSYKLQA